MAIKRTSSNSISNAVKLSTGFSSAAIPNSPTIGTATATSDVAATVTYTAAVLGATGSTFTATSNPGSVTGTGSSPITVTGLTASTSYTFSVTAGNANGTSAASSASNSITTSAPLGSYESIATTTLSSSQATVTFSSIPATFKHLQVRISAKNTRTGEESASVFFEVNDDTSNNNYTTHYMSTVGSTPTSFGRATGNYTGLSGISPSADVTSNLGVMIYDFIDYTNTNKYKTIRSINGYDANGSGSIYLSSNLWLNTNAISTIKFTVPAFSWAQYSKFALYGIKG